MRIQWIWRLVQSNNLSRMAVVFAFLAAAFLPFQKAKAGTLALASFPEDVISYSGGSIQFWAQINDVNPSDVIQCCGDHRLISFEDSNHSSWHIEFNANDGASGGGIVAAAGKGIIAGTGEYWNTYTYSSVLNGQANGWHYYSMTWSSSGLPGGDAASGHMVALYVDGQLNSSQFMDDYFGHGFPGGPSGFFPLVGGGVTNGQILIGADGISIQDLRTFDAAGNELLYNTLGSIAAIEHSIIGLDGAYLRGEFVDGVNGGQALRAPGGGSPTPVPEPSFIVLLALSFGCLGLACRIKGMRIN